MKHSEINSELRFFPGTSALLLKLYCKDMLVRYQKKARKDTVVGCRIFEMESIHWAYLRAHKIIFGRRSRRETSHGVSENRWNCGTALWHCLTRY